MSYRSAQPAHRPSTNLPASSLPAHRVGCPCCGLSLSIPALTPGESALCPRCHQHLVRIEIHPLDTPTAYAIASLIIMTIVYTQLYMSIDLFGIHVELTIPYMVATLAQQDYSLLAEIMFFLTFGSPVLFLLLCLYVFTGLRYQQVLPGMLYATRTLVRLRHWIMVDVFYIATLVSYIKISGMAQIHFGLAFWFMMVLGILLIRTSQGVPEHWIFYQIQRLTGHDPTLQKHNKVTINCHYCLFEQPDTQNVCDVCGSYLSRRKPLSLSISMAFLLAAIIFYIPANLLPMMITRSPGTNLASTILDGIEYMWNDGDVLIAVVIFSASMAIPVLKIISMLVLLYSAAYRPLMSARKLTVLYRITESIGRWSMIDIFVVIILMSAFSTPLAHVTPGAATIYFCAVVILTMISALSFDPRLIWDEIKQHPSHHKSSNKRHSS
ncbi:paraquat-inducible protein A [Snodgrassella sp.]|uniref:paraquat-inducible protein A n=1 Tax=Snodgrassella sp. TaxID=2815304 RepID=UPI00258D589E|nr:paraquat-inducible protein A [Snodgrassella sp.]MCO6525186.1 paraquat-inducible protein A [Snodgrassella sp.]